MIGNIQFLRAYAALSVALYHTGSSCCGVPYGFDLGGVSLFFVISGYLMCNFLHETPREFYLKRLIRIVPLYWAATALSVYLFGGFLWHDWRDVVMSLLFVPHWSAQGHWQPTLAVGWTLVLEMFFYTLLALSMALVGRRAPLLAGVVLIGAFAAAPFMPQLLTLYFGNAYILQFVCGIAIYYGLAALRGRLVLSSWLWLASALLAGGMLAVFKYHLAYVFPGLIVAIALLLAANGRDLKSPAVLLIGDASYAIYLLHTIMLEWLRQHGIVVTNDPLRIAAYFVVLVAVSCAVYLALEKPLRAQLRRRVFLRESGQLATCEREA